MARDLSGALNSEVPRDDKPVIAKPGTSLLQDLEQEAKLVAHHIAHSRLLGAEKHCVSDLRKTALHGAALLMQAVNLHDEIDSLTELEADMLLIKHEAKLVKDKVMK